MNTNKLAIIRKIINKTKDGELVWSYRGDNDVYYDPHKEQYFTQYDITDNKMVDISITKHDFEFNYNIYVNIYFNSYDNNELKIHKKIEEIYFQNIYNLFELFAYVKYDSALKDDFFLDSFKNSLYNKKYNWTLKNDKFFQLVLEKSRFNDDRIYIIVLKSMFVIYLKKGENKKIINNLNDTKLFDFLKKNYRNGK